MAHQEEQLVVLLVEEEELEVELVEGQVGIVASEGPNRIPVGNPVVIKLEPRLLVREL